MNSGLTESAYLQLKVKGAAPSPRNAPAVSFLIESYFVHVAQLASQEFLCPPR